MIIKKFINQKFLGTSPTTRTSYFIGEAETDEGPKTVYCTQSIDSIHPAVWTTNAPFIPADAR